MGEYRPVSIAVCGTFNSSDIIRHRKYKTEIDKVIFNDPTTIVYFTDGDKIVVRAHDEPFDKEKGLAMAIARKHYSRAEIVRALENAIVQEPK